MGVNIEKNGIIKIGTFTEFISNPFDNEVYIEPDGSAWIRIFHHNNPANAQFTSSDTFDSQVYKDADRWFNVALCNYISNSWEFMIKQKTTSTATEVKYRWIQYANPMTAVFGDVDVEDVTKIVTTGYSEKTTYGGIYYKNAATYLCINNSNSSNWFGAIGAWNTYQGGVPGYSASITTGYMDLYLRMDNHTNLKNTSFGENYIKTREIIEV